jgi:hypothetical protein
MNNDEKEVRLLMSKMGYDSIKKRYFHKDGNICTEKCPDESKQQLHFTSTKIGSLACFDCENCIAHGEKGDNWIKCIKIEELEG